MWISELTERAMRTAIQGAASPSMPDGATYRLAHVNDAPTKKIEATIYPVVAINFAGGNRPMGVESFEYNVPGTVMLATLYLKDRKREVLTLMEEAARTIIDAGISAAFAVEKALTTSTFNYQGLVQIESGPIMIGPVEGESPQEQSIEINMVVKACGGPTA
ncbi:MAG: hypothetical protein GY820_39780 [Gammaproteobacteria bacterium]|nr:hypothetical protein [Gammaproteobacteria bacterium]